MPTINHRLAFFGIHPKMMSLLMSICRISILYLQILTVVVFLLKYIKKFGKRIIIAQEPKATLKNWHIMNRIMFGVLAAE